MKNKNNAISAFLKQKMDAKGIVYLKDLADVVGMDYPSLRQAIWSNRFPADKLESFCKHLNITKNEVKEEGLQFVAIRRGVNRPDLGHMDILPLMSALVETELKNCTLREVLYLSRIQQRLPVDLTKDMIVNLLDKLRD